MVRLSSAAAFGIVLVTSACSKGTEPPVATTIAITPSATLNLASINQSSQLTATVLDQRADTMAGQTVTWTSNSATVATVSATGLVTAHANGSTTVTATLGSAHTDVAVTVAQVPSGLAKAGDNQTGTVGAALATSISVHVTDALGTPVAGVVLGFVVSSGGGNVSSPTAPTNAAGDAGVTWTLGTSTAVGQVVSVSAGALVATFNATATAGPVSAVSVTGGNNQSAATGTAVAIKPTVKVADSFGNGKAGVTVIFAVVSGGGSGTGLSQITNAAGTATVGNWTMGGAAGSNTMSATVQGTAITTTITATAVLAGAPKTVAVIYGNNQTALVTYPTNVRPAVLVTDISGLPVNNATVTFAIATGGGSVTTGVVNTNASGIAQVGKWTVGAAAGSNTMTATVTGSGITGNPVTFAATGATANYTITIQNAGPAFNAPVQAAFDSAVAFWRRVIYQTIGQTTVNAPANACGAGWPAVNQTVTDVMIQARVDTIDGPGQILGSAGPCFIQTGSRLTVLGTMRFDSADIAGLVANGSLVTVIRHEMGHVLGLGTLWTQTAFNCLQLPASAGVAPDTYFSCAKGLAAFDSIGGTSYTGGNKVPVENCSAASPAGCGAGTFNGHWREPTFGTELMTGYINSGVPNYASLLTIAAMEDLNYVVNYGAAEPYSKVFTVSPLLRAAAAGDVVDLHDDINHGPIYSVDRMGRVTGVSRIP